MRKIVLLSLLLSTASIFTLSNTIDSATYVNYPSCSFQKVVAIDGNDKIGKERKEETTPTKTISMPQRSQEEPKEQPQLSSRSENYETIKMRITAYTSSPDEGYYITKTGIDLHNSHPPIIAVDPRVIPLHSTVEINGVKYKAEDTGSAIKGNRIDMLVNTKKQASDWGVQYLDVKVYK